MTKDRQLDELVAEVRKITVTAEQLGEQRRSFAYGNARIENERITREMIAEADRKIMADDYNLYRDRDSISFAEEAGLLNDPDEVARREAENSVALFNLVDDVIRTWLDRGGFKLHKGVFVHLHWVAARER
ncbi:MAG TPA: hypothetical protein VGA51_00780 [Casimicrobiaceae bacterium]